MAIDIKNLYKSYGELVICEDFNMTLENEKITGLLGPSGCGKTTLLNILAGLEEYDSGTIDGLEGKTLSYIFQEDRLIPWSTVKDNIVFVLKSIYDDHEGGRIADEYLQMVGLKDYAHYYPHQLSGGMKQRVAIARAFAYPADILLMDEPFKGLDLDLKTGLIESFLRLWEEDKRTVIFVTHDLEEARSLGHYIYHLDHRPLRIKEKVRVN